MKNTLVIYSEDSHDALLISLLEACNIHKINVVLFLSSNKYQRITSSINFVSNQGLISVQEISRMNFVNAENLVYFGFQKISKVIRRLIKFILFIKYYILDLELILFELKKSDKYNLICLENYSPLSNLVLNRILTKLNNRLEKTKIIIYNLEDFENKQKKLLVGRFNGILAVNDTVINNIPKNVNKPVNKIPFSTTNPHFIEQRKVFYDTRKKSDKKYRFVIIGEISSNRRDYKTILDRLSILAIENYELNLLGKLVDQSPILEAINQGIDIVTHQGYVSQNEFDAVLLNSDFILYKSSKNQKYHETKGSGVVYDSMRYGVPIITFEPIESEYLDQSTIYTINSSSDLNELLDTLEYFDRLCEFKELVIGKMTYSYNLFTKEIIYNIIS
jgi:hypothetical protein